MKEEWIKDIGNTIKEYEKELIFKTGLDFITLASVASEVEIEKIVQAAQYIKIGVIPITTGLGIIGSFSESVAGVLHSMGFEVFITDSTDVTGIHEAHQKGASIIFLADDDKFIALNLEKNLIAENSQATAKGYVAALEGAVGKLKDQEVLIIGCGVVGKEALTSLKLKGARPIVYDTNQRVLINLANEGYEIVSDIDKIAQYPLVFDASSEGRWIKKGMLHPKAWIATPGVPLSLDAEAYDYHKDRVIHDYLPIGVATMLATACK